MRGPHTSLNIKVSLSQHSQPSSSTQSTTLEKKIFTKVKITYLNNEQQHLFKYLKCILNSKNKRIPEDGLQLDP